MFIRSSDSNKDQAQGTGSVTDICVFVKNIPKSMKQVELYEIMEQHGEIKMLMLSLEHNHRSKGFGFVYFVEAQSAKRAIEHGPHLDNNQIVAQSYNPEN